MDTDDMPVDTDDMTMDTDDEAFFAMIEALPPTSKQISFINRMAKHFRLDIDIPTTREDATLLVQNLLDRLNAEKGEQDADSQTAA